MKKNIKKIPSYISAKLELIADNEILVVAVGSFSKKEIESNLLSKIGVKLENDALVVPKTFLPFSESGRFSKKNREGYLIVRRDLPKVNKTIDLGERYPFGNTKRTPFNLSYDRLVYQRQFIEPMNLQLLIELLDCNDSQGETCYTFKVGISNVYKKDSDTFNSELLFALNILKENFAKIDIFSKNATTQDFMKTQNVAWEIIPAGERDYHLEKILSSFTKLTEKDKEKIKERYDFIASLQPESIIIGTGGMNRYFGAKFLENLVVFENLDYGNAIYVMYEEWQTLSKISRTNLLEMDKSKFDRIKHTENWKDRVTKLVSSKLKFNKKTA
jgi:hypothetical protein